MLLPQDYGLNAMSDNWRVSIRRVCILGSTGSIGTQALEVIDQHKDRFEVIGLSAGENVELLATQIEKFKPKSVSVSTQEAADKLKIKKINHDFKLLVGPEASGELASINCDVVLNGITGAAGLLATINSLKTGNRLALANKESLVIGGKLVLDLASENQIIPVDSEHSALAQCLRGEKKSEIRKLILTASGGPFRGKKLDELKNVNLDETLKHPTWNMGPVVTINSATLMNKGLEIIEAHLLFGIKYENIEVVIHPQSIIHSMVEFIDGSTMAQASPPNMKIPIALSLSWPERLKDIYAPISWNQNQSWVFENVNSEVFKAPDLARRAGQKSGSAPAVMNAVNEECVSAFIEQKISFLSIVEIVENLLTKHITGDDYISNENLTLDSLLKTEAQYRTKAKEIISNKELEV